MTKMALCIRRQDYLDLINNLEHNTSGPVTAPHECSILVGSMIDKFDQLPAQLVSRDICETDESFLQIIPYVTMVKEGKEILSYKRGKAGNEDRLHDLYSIGFGGHVESYESNSIVYSYVNCIVQELKEELGIELTNEEIASFIDNQSRHIALIYHNDPGSVNAVHLGVFCVCNIDKDDVTKPEIGVIESLRYHSAIELLDPSTFTDGKLEPWSRIVANLLVHTYKLN